MASMSLRLFRQVSCNIHHAKYRSFPTRRYTTTRQRKNPEPSKNNTLLPPPGIEIDPSKGVLHQKAARAAQLHAELNALLDAQAQRRADEMNRAFGSGFIDFLRTSKSEVINILAAFACVVLAWQVAGFQKRAKNMSNDAAEKDALIAQLKALLKVLSSEEFCTKTLEQYFDKVKEGEAQKSDTSKSTILFGFKVKNASDPKEKQDDKELLRIILLRELHNVIGNVALSDLELQEKKINDLQTDMKEMVSDSSLGDLERALGEVQVYQGDTNNTVATSRTGFI